MSTTNTTTNTTLITPCAILRCTEAASVRYTLTDAARPDQNHTRDYCAQHATATRETCQGPGRTITLDLLQGEAPPVSPCPSWCLEPAGHSWLPGDMAGDWARSHSAFYVEGTSAAWSVEVYRIEEHRAGARSDRSVVSPSAPGVGVQVSDELDARVTVAGLDGDYSDPDLLREAAAVLLRMAQQLDQERAR